MRDIRLLVTQTHWPDEALVLDRPARKVGPDERRLGNHALPALLVRLLARADGLEHLLLTDAAHLWDGHAEARRLLRALALDGAAERLCAARGRTVEEVLRQGLSRGGGVAGGLDVLLLVRAERLLELDLLLVALGLVQLGAQAA